MISQTCPLEPTLTAHPSETEKPLWPKTDPVGYRDLIIDKPASMAFALPYPHRRRLPELVCQLQELGGCHSRVYN